jgi:uncharacterized UPF0146 family protein
MSEYIAGRYGKCAEIGIGHFPDLALALAAKGVEVFATDIVPLTYEGLRVIIDDVTSPDISLFYGVDLIYSMRPPPELVFYMERLAASLSADLIVKPLSSEFVDGRESVRFGGTTFFEWSHGRLREEGRIGGEKDNLSCGGGDR